MIQHVYAEITAKHVIEIEADSPEAAVERCHREGMNVYEGVSPENMISERSGITELRPATPDEIAEVTW